MTTSLSDTKYNVKDYALWTALVTPFDDKGNVDYPTLAKLADEQADAGNGLLVLGSTGEGLALDENEQEKIVRFICQHQPNAPIMVAVGGYNLTSQLRWIELCNDLPIAGYLLAAPLYAKPGPVGQEKWFRALLQASKLPCMLYNVPSRSGVELVPQALINLLDEPNFWSLKEASGCVSKFSEFKKSLPNIALYSGDDALLPEFAELGATGLVSVCANAWPKATQLYVSKCLSETTNNEFGLWKLAVESLFTVANPIPVKVLMHQRKQISFPILRLPLTHNELACHLALKSADTSIQAWYGKQIA